MAIMLTVAGNTTIDVCNLFVLMDAEKQYWAVIVWPVLQSEEKGKTTRDNVSQSPLSCISQTCW